MLSFKQNPLKVSSQNNDTVIVYFMILQIIRVQDFNLCVGVHLLYLWCVNILVRGHEFVFLFMMCKMLARGHVFDL